MNIYKVLSAIYYVGMAFVFLGVLMYISDTPFALVTFTSGAIVMVGIRLYNVAAGKPENRRVFSILLYSSLFLLGASWCMYTHRRYWILFIIMTAVLDTFASYRKIKH